MKILLTVLILAVVAGLVYVRFSAPDLERWHKTPRAEVPGDDAGMRRFMAVRQFTTRPADILRAFDKVATASPRTRRIAGSVEEGMITYETRTALIGFPDYTTVAVLDGPLLAVHGRARFAGYDWGVNAGRVNDWLAALGPLVVTPGSEG